MGLMVVLFIYHQQLGWEPWMVAATANVYIVTISERLAKQTGNPALAITPALWFLKGTPAMLITLVLCTVFIWLGYHYLYVEDLGS